MNFELITAHFGDSFLEQVANTNFLVYLTNAFCLVRKIKKLWLPLFEEFDTKSVIECIENASKLAFAITFRVF